MKKVGTKSLRPHSGEKKGKLTEHFRNLENSENKNNKLFWSVSRALFKCAQIIHFDDNALYKRSVFTHVKSRLLKCVIRQYSSRFAQKYIQLYTNVWSSILQFYTEVKWEQIK